MAQTGFTPIITYHSTTGAAVPDAADLSPGELAVNIADMKLYAENDSGVVTLLASADAAAGNFTTVTATNLQVTNIKANDGTAAGSIADSTGIVTFASTVLTTTDINGGSIDAVTLGTNSAVTEAQIDNINIDSNTISTTDTDGNLILSPDGSGTVQEEVGGVNYDLASQYDIGTAPNEIPLNQYLGNLAYQDAGSIAGDLQAGSINNTAIGGSTPAAGSFTTLNTSGAVVFNDAGADVDFRVEGDTEANLLFVDASTDRLGVGTNTPATRLHAKGGFPTAILERDGGTTTATGLGLTNSTNSGFIVTGSDTTFTITASTNVSGGASLTERMRITADGEVLVGGTTSISSTNALTIERASNAILNLYRSGTSILNGSILGTIDFYGADTTSNTPTRHAYINATASGTHAAGDNPTDLVFGCTNDGSGTVAEFARLQQIGTASRAFQVVQPTLIDNQFVRVRGIGGTAGTNNRNGQIGAFKHSGITNACGYVGLHAEDGIEDYLWVDNSDILRISTSTSNIGTTGGTVVGTQTSDERLKDISGPVSYGLNEVLAIEPIAFTMKDDPSIPKIGFSAQQVQPIVPEAVYDTNECIDGYTENEETKEQIANSDRTKLAMEYTQLIPVLVNAVKELSAKCDALQAEVNLLKGN